MSNVKMLITQRINDLRDEILELDQELREAFELRTKLLAEFGNLKHNPDSYIAAQEQKILDDIKSGKVVLCDASTGEELKLLGLHK